MSQFHDVLGRKSVFHFNNFLAAGHVTLEGTPTPALPPRPCICPLPHHMSTRESALFRLARGRGMLETPTPTSQAPRTTEAVVEPPEKSQKTTTPQRSEPIPVQPDPTPVRVLSWDQDSQCVFIRVGVPKGTPVSRVKVESTVTSLCVSVSPEQTAAKWYTVSQSSGTIEQSENSVTLRGAPNEGVKENTISGDLTYPCVASDTMWTIDRCGDEDEICIVLTKQNKYLSSAAWMGLFIGDEEKSLVQVAKEMHDSDEPSPRHCELPEAAQIAVEDARELRLKMGSGEYRPGVDNDDFRVVLSNETVADDDVH